MIIRCKYSNQMRNLIAKILVPIKLIDYNTVHMSALVQEKQLKVSFLAEICIVLICLKKIITFKINSIIRILLKKKRLGSSSNNKIQNRTAVQQIKTFQKHLQNIFKEKSSALKIILKILIIGSVIWNISIKTNNNPILNKELKEKINCII